MYEKLPTRREADQANYENNENYQAVNTLVETGLLVKMDELELYHGRSGDHEEWRVRPEFDNADNITGNANINKISALNTSHRNIADEFAARRARSRGGTPEVHRILSEDPDAHIIDSSFNFYSLNHDQQAQFISAIRKTLPGITSGAPLDFAYRDALTNLTPRDFPSSDRSGLIYAEDVDKSAHRLHIDPELNHKIVSTKNTMQLLGNYPQLIQSLLFAYMDNQSSIGFYENHKTHTIPFNREYLSSWFRNTHTVGCKMSVNSATLGHQVIDNFLLFDLEKVNTDQETARRKERINRRFGQIALNAERHRSRGTLAETLTNNLYVKPEEIITLAKTTPGYKGIFESDAGNWEKYTLEEHTETVLRLFDNNYADSLPASTLPVMRLALLVHDIGKSEAVRNHDKAHQKAYNLAYAKDFMTKNNIDPVNRELVLSMIGDGLEYASRWMVKRERGVGREFYGFCEKTMKDYLGTNEVDPETVTGFRNMLEVLQTCDSAAYTTMAVTRSTRNGVVYRNYGSFNSSFEPFHGLNGHRAKFKGGTSPH